MYTQRAVIAIQSNTGATNVASPDSSLPDMSTKPCRKSGRNKSTVSESLQYLTPRVCS